MKKTYFLCTLKYTNDAFNEHLELEADMDPVTHAFVGMSAAKILQQGIDMTNPYTLAATIGSVFPDIDIMLQRWGDYVYLKNHRGVTHSIVGLIASSTIISFSLYMIFKCSFIKLLLFSLIGSFSHLAIDMFNSYGAKILWPFINKKYSVSALTSFDPVVLAFSVLAVFTSGAVEWVFLLFCGAYIALRLYIRNNIKTHIEKRYQTRGRNKVKINVMPSMKGIYFWHLVIDTSKFVIVGNVNFITNKMVFAKRMRKLDDKTVKKALKSPVGRFFKEFTPVFHIKKEKQHEVTRYVFIDLRYYLRNKFLHHGVLEIDNKKGEVKNILKPYSQNRVVFINPQ